MDDPDAPPGAPPPSGGSTTSGAAPGRPNSAEELKTDDDRAVAAAIGVANVLMDCEYYGRLSLEADSVYGSAIAIPQIARSTSWNSTFTMLAVRSWCLLILNICLQLGLLLFIGQASQVMDVLGGKMHLCDFGATLGSCPESSTCDGPGGTKFTATGLYDWDSFSVRTFFRDSMLAIQPGMKSKIEQVLDPQVGEYGIESYTCRVACGIIFTMSVVAEAWECSDLFFLLLKLPTDATSWIRYVPYSKVDGCKAEGFLPLNMLGFEMGGIPLMWKLINTITVLIPKTFLCVAVMWEGYRFIMETSAIVDLVLGSMAMGFILNIDEMILSCLGSPSVVYIMDNLEDKPLFKDLEKEEGETDDMIIQKVHEDNLKVKADTDKSRVFWIMVPQRLVVLFVLRSIFSFKYYFINCTRSGDSGYYSKAMFLPKSTRYTFSDFVMGELLGLRDVTEDDVAWQMEFPHGVPGQEEGQEEVVDVVD